MARGKHVAPQFEDRRFGLVSSTVLESAEIRNIRNDDLLTPSVIADAYCHTGNGRERGG